MRRSLLPCLLLAASCAAQQSRPGAPASEQVGEVADLVGTDLDGHEVRVSDAAGKVRVVDFWATWCSPCLDQLPLLDRLQREQGARGLAVFGVAVDEEREAVLAFLGRVPVSFPVLHDPAGESTARRLDITRLPTTVVLDRKGAVRDVHLGYDAAGGQRLEAKVLELLAE